MDTVKSLNKWANRHTSYPIDALRITLGVFLFMKGVAFATGNQQVADAFAPVSNLVGGSFFLTYIISAHIMGGILIAVGLLTRWCIWAELPILIGAVAVNFIGPMVPVNLVMALVALGVCIFFLAYGSGRHSADYYFKMQK